ncbi:MAG TPA: hypothetical protein VF796_07660, partial [Humisphaera sp.]
MSRGLLPVAATACSALLAVALSAVAGGCAGRGGPAKAGGAADVPRIEPVVAPGAVSGSAGTVSGGTASGGTSGVGTAAKPASAPAAVGPAGGNVPAIGPAVRLAAAGNEWTNFTVTLKSLPADARAAGRLSVRVAPPAGVALAPADVEVYELVDLPADLNRAHHVRQAGTVPPAKSLPRALVPLARAGDRFEIPKQPATTPGGTTRPADAPLTLWVDVRVPPGAAPGTHAAALEVLATPERAKSADAAKPVARLPFELAVHTFALPAERALKVVGVVSWEQLVRHFPDDFEAAVPLKVSRTSPVYKGTVAVLDAMQSLAQRHRAAVVFDGLQPVVKWPALVNGDQPAPDVWWDDFDALIDPWMSGSAFADKVGVGCWAVPVPDGIETYDTKSRLAYWERAASHFDRKDWLRASAIWLKPGGTGRGRAAGAIELSIEAAQL